MFRYNYIGNTIARLINLNGSPLQVELQPGIHCAGFRCPYCYGKDQKIFKDLVQIKDIEKLLIDIKGKLEFFAIGGIVTDPQTYPYFNDLIKIISDYGFKFGISTKGNLINENIIKTLSDKTHFDSFINFSIDAPNNEIYCKQRGWEKVEPLYDQIKYIVKKLHNRCQKNSSKLRIKVSYLLFNVNAKEEYFDKFVRDFENITSEIRFSIPQTPNTHPPIGYLTKNEINETLTLLNKFKNNDKVVVLPFTKSEHSKSFNKCWAQQFNVTIDSSGNAYPCPQVSTKYYSHLIIGNIKEQSLWEIWNSQKRKNLFNADVDKVMRCRVCDRKDETINIELTKIITPDLYSMYDLGIKNDKHRT